MNARLDKISLSAAIDAVFTAVKEDRSLLAGPAALSYGDLHTRMQRLQGVFNHHRLKTGDRVAIVSRDDAAVISLYFAAIRAGLVAVIGDGHATTDEVERLMKAADPALAFIDRSLLPAGMAGTLPGQKAHMIAISDGGHASSLGIVYKLLGRAPTSPASSRDPHEFPHLLGKFEPAAFPPPAGDEAVAHILFTSGTTSRPKGVEITHGNIRAQLATFLSVYGYDADSRILNVLPLHHTDGLMQGPAVAFIAEATVYRPGRFEIQKLSELMDSVRREHITHFIVVPTMLALMMRLGEEHDDCLTGPNFRCIRSSADLLDPTLWRLFEERFGVEVTNSYGLTETVCEAVYCGPDPATKRIGTIGKPIDCEARIVDASGNNVAAGEVGELWISGANIMKGYFRQPEETAAVLTDGWYHTGDLAHADADGFLTLAGRKKTVIITGGINVHPENITTAIRGLAGVMDAVTFGLEDATWGEVVTSCVVVAPDSGLDEDAILAHCRTNLSAEKVPAAIHLLDALPRGPAGKVLLADVKAIAAERAKIGFELTGDIAEQVLAIAASVFSVPVSTLSPESTPYNTNGWDSLAHISFITALEEQFDFRMSPSDIISLYTLADAVLIIRGALGACSHNSPAG